MLKFAATTLFHFVLDKDLLKNLCIEADNQKVSVSELIDQALNRAYFLIEKAEFVLLKINTSDFKEDDLIMDCNIKITIDRKFKNKLFNMQDHFHLKSKASLLRYIIRKYLLKIERWYRQKNSPKKDVRARCLRMWNKAKVRRTITSFGIWDKYKIDHMDCFYHPPTTYIFDSMNQLCRIVHKKLFKTLI